MNGVVKIEIRLGNEAMQSGADVAAALRALADRLERDGLQCLQTIKDENGNRVGEVSIVEQ